MKSQFIINFCINFWKKYKKEILWWIFFRIFSPTIDFNQIPYRPQNQKPKPFKYKEKFNESEEKQL